MKLQLFEYRCLKCGCEFESPELVPSTYGFFLARSAASDSRAILNALDDPVYREVEVMLDIMGVTDGLDVIQKADLLQAVFGKTCDPASDGSEYAIAAKPQCPRCHCRRPLSWQASDPPRFSEETLPEITHRQWAGIGVVEKRARIAEGVRQCLD